MRVLPCMFCRAPRPITQFGRCHTCGARVAGEAAPPWWRLRLVHLVRRAVPFVALAVLTAFSIGLVRNVTIPSAFSWATAAAPLVFAFAGFYLLVMYHEHGSA